MYHRHNGPCKLQIAKSRVPGGGYGVFTKKLVKKDELLEVTPFIEVPKHIVFGQPNILQNYVFTSHCKPGHVLVVFGNGSMYNHSTKPNVVYRINGQNRKRFLNFEAMQDIPAGAELLINYGPDHLVNH